MKRKWTLILIVALFLISCMAGCSTNSTDSSELESVSLSSEIEPAEDPSSESQNFVEEVSAPVFDFESRTVMLNSGYEMPIVGLGTYALSDEECYNSVTALLEAGGGLLIQLPITEMRKVLGGLSGTVTYLVRKSSLPQKSILQNLTIQRRPSKDVWSVWTSDI